MRFSGKTFAAALPLIAQATNVVISNDDGWAEMNIRQLYNSLVGAGFDAIISAPAENESGTGSSDATPTTVGSDGCEFSSCPPGSPAYGYNASMPRFNYVNSYPVTSMRYGVQNLSETWFGGRPDMAVAGPNVGSNLGATTLISGTVGAATEASKEGIPGLAFSGTTGSQTAWNATPQLYEQIYANLATLTTATLVESGTPYLPPNTWLNINYPRVTSTTCSSVSDFKFVLSRIYPGIPVVDAPDFSTGCAEHGDFLPDERTVVGTNGCYASISVGLATTKLDAGAAEQGFVYQKLKGILSCLPSASGALTIQA